MSLSGVGANVLGYADQDVDEAVKQAIAKGTSSSLNCLEEVKLAEFLCELHPWAEMVRYTRAGGEAIAVAVRIARAHTGRDKVAFCGYHGWHDWYLAANLGSEKIPLGYRRDLLVLLFPSATTISASLKRLWLLTAKSWLR
jgi:glutamate-1-semialdehyde 2,1-aminomutase